jgi:hypothetical protein
MRPTTTNSNTWAVNSPPFTRYSATSGDRGQALTVVEAAIESRRLKTHVYNVIAGKVGDVCALPAISMGQLKLEWRSALEHWMETSEGRCSRSGEAFPTALFSMAPNCASDHGLLLMERILYAR